VDFVTLTRRFNLAEVSLIRSRLEAAGFHVETANEGAALSLEGYSLTAGGILIKVPEAQAEDARALLASLEDEGK
jgi:hypothetical protein